MITINEAAKHYAKKCIYSIWKQAFTEGAKFAQRWIPVEDELPPCGDKDFLIKGIDDRGIEGIVDVGYMHDSPDNKPSINQIISLGGVLIKVTHWRYIDIDL